MVNTSPTNSGGVVDDNMQAVFFWIFWASVVVGVVVSLLLVYSYFRFRRKSDDEEPVQFHGNTKLEVAWTMIPFLILITLFGVSTAHMGLIANTPDNTSMHVSVIGQQFSWAFYYEGMHDSKGNQLKSLLNGEGVSVLYVPQETNVELKLASTDPAPKCSVATPLKPAPGQTWADAASARGCGVNHSFYVPTLAGQMNAIPGQVNTMWLSARQGVYYGQCTELCGSGHAEMLLEVRAVTAQQYSCMVQNATAGTLSDAVAKGCGVEVTT